MDNKASDQEIYLHYHTPRNNPVTMFGQSYGHVESYIFTPPSPKKMVKTPPLPSCEMTPPSLPD